MSCCYVELSNTAEQARYLGKETPGLALPHVPHGAGHGGGEIPWSHTHPSKAPLTPTYSRCREGEVKSFFEVMVRAREKEEILVGLKPKGAKSPQLNPKGKGEQVRDMPFQRKSCDRHLPQPPSADV